MNRTAPQTLGLLVAMSNLCFAQMTVMELTESIDKRHAALRNLVFDYDVRYMAKTRNTPGGFEEIFDTNGRFFKSRDQFKLLGLWQGSAWTRYTRNRSGRLLLDRFAGAEGTTAACFWRPMNRFERNQVRIQSGNGFANSGYLIGQNTFADFLFMRINGITEWESQGQLTDELRYFNLDSYKIARRERIDGRYVYLLKAAGISGNPGWTIRYEVEVSGAPEFLVLRWEAIDDTNQTIASYIVKDIGKIDDFSYPAAGTHFNKTPGTQADLVEYEYDFKVRSARKMTPNECASIFPTWPKNSQVSDGIKEVAYVTPHISITNAKSQPWNFLTYAWLGSVFSIATLSAAWFAWSTRRFHWRLAGLIVAFTVPTIALCWYWDELIASAYATTIMLSLAISIVVRTVFGTSIVSANRIAESRIGARDWIVLALSPPYVWLLIAHPELSRLDVTMALGWGVSGIVLLLALFRGWLASRKRFLIASTVALLTGVSFFVWLFWASQNLKYAWQTAASHFGAVICVVAVAAIARAIGFRVVSDSCLATTDDARNPVAFGLRELFVWVAAMGSCMAVLGLLSQAY